MLYNLRRKERLFLSLGGETELVLLGIEDNVLGLEEDVTEDVDTNVTSGLETTEALATLLGVVEVLAGNSGGVRANGDLEVRESGRAVKDPATLGLGVLGTADLLVVGGDGAVVQEEQGGTGVGNTLDGATSGLDLGVTNADGVGGEAPEALAVVDISVGKLASVLGGVDESKVVRAGLVVLQDSSEDGGGQAVHDVGVEGLLGLGLDSVDAAESETEETVAGGVLGERAGHSGGSLNSLGGGSDVADGDGVSVDITAGGAAVTVGDLPGSTAELLAGAGVVVVVARAGTLGVGSVDPAVKGLARSGIQQRCQLNLQIGGTGVKVKVHGGLANLDRGDVLLVTVDGLVGGRARLTASGSRGDVGRDGATVLVESLGVGSGTVDLAGSLDSDLVQAELGSSGRVVGSGLGGSGEGQGRDNSLCVNHFGRRYKSPLLELKGGDRESD